MSREPRMPIHPSRAALASLALVLLACRASTDVVPERVTEAEMAARRAVAAERSLATAELPERTIAVPPLRADGTDTLLAPLAYGLADLLMTDLARSAQLQVLDRVRLDAMLRELQLVSAGRVDSAAAPRVGRLVGARRLVIGAIAAQEGDRIVVDARLADVTTGEVQLAASATARLADILDAEKALAFRIFDQLGVNLTPAERAAVDQRPTRNLQALLSYSRGVRFEAEGRYAAAAAEYQRAITLDPSFEQARRRLNDFRMQGSTASLLRASALAVERVNRVQIAPNATRGNPGAADASFPEDAVTVLVTIVTPP
jgi:TolB-like protein